MIFGASTTSGLAPGRQTTSLPGASVQRRGLILEQRADHLHVALAGGEYRAAGQVERRVLDMVAGQRAQAGLAQAVNDAADAGPIERAGAHRAWLGGAVERA